MMRAVVLGVAIAAMPALSVAPAIAQKTTAAKPAVKLEDKYATSDDGTKIHYVASGKGPLVLAIHGFPDYSADFLPITESKFQPDQSMILPTGYPDISFTIDHEGSGLLMSRQDQLYRGLANRFDQVEILLSWNTENTLHAFVLEGGDEQIRTFDHGHLQTASRVESTPLTRAETTSSSRPAFQTPPAS